MNLRQPFLLASGFAFASALALVACKNDEEAGATAGPVRAAQLHGSSCALVGTTARLTVDVRVGPRDDPPSFRVLSVGCAPACSALLGESGVIAVRADTEGAATVQAVVAIEKYAPLVRTVTVARVVQFVGSGVCDGGSESGFASAAVSE